MIQPKNKYTNSQWSREIGWGKVPNKHLYKKSWKFLSTSCTIHISDYGGLKTKRKTNELP